MKKQKRRLMIPRLLGINWLKLWRLPITWLTLTFYILNRNNC